MALGYIRSSHACAVWLASAALYTCSIVARASVRLAIAISQWLLCHKDYFSLSVVYIDARPPPYILKLWASCFGKVSCFENP